MMKSINTIFMLRFLSLLLFLFDVVNLGTCISPDELNVPYVPYVVVNKDKDEFDYDRLQETIVKYLENRSEREFLRDAPVTSSTFLHDFPTSHKTSSIPAGQRLSQNFQLSQELQPVADTRSINVHSYESSGGFRPSTGGVRDNSLVTAELKITTYQPHLYRTTLPPYTKPLYSNNTNSVVKSYNNVPFQFTETMTPKFIPLKSSFMSSAGFLIGADSDSMGEDRTPSFNTFPFEGEMKCNLRSSRLVYDGDCVSKKPVVETVCADRCIKYEYSKVRNPVFIDDIQKEKITKAGAKKTVIALTCKDGDVRKEKVKLYCKDGTIINNVIRIVNNCICHEHHEKVQSTKRRSYRTQMVLPMRKTLRRPMIRFADRFSDIPRTIIK